MGTTAEATRKRVCGGHKYVLVLHCLKPKVAGVRGGAGGEAHNNTAQQAS